MKRALVTVIAGLAGFAAGRWIAPTPSAASQEPAMTGKASERWNIPPGKGLSHLERLAAIAATLSHSDWPAFFKARQHSPQETRLAARLWAETDPAGFWEWLRESRDRDRFERFGTDLLKRWCEQDPEAAMAAVMAITDQALGDRFRTAVIEAVLERDTALGLDFVARVGDLPGWDLGEKPWITRDPALAARSLVELPLTHEFRAYLNHAVPAWAGKDPEACLAWLRETPPPEKTQWPRNWVIRGFKEVARANPEGALQAARELADPAHRSQALAGVIASCQVTPDGAAPWLEQIRLEEMYILSEELGGPLQALTGDLADGAGLLELIPANRNSTGAFERIAREWSKEEPAAAWEWAASIDDPAMSRAALAAAVEGMDAGRLDAIADLPFASLSNTLLRKAVANIPADQREIWAAGMPADRADWVRRLAETQ